MVDAGDDVELVVVSRFRAELATEELATEELRAEELRAGLHVAHAALAARPGYVGGHVGRNLDDPDLWLLTTSWANVGSYRRALSSYDVKVSAVPLLSRAIDEPSAYESDLLGGDTNVQRPRDLR